MKPEICFEDFVKLKLVIGEIIEINENNIKISIGNKTLEENKKGDFKKGDKILVGLQEDNLIIPLVNNSVIIPEKDIEVGSRIG